MRGTDRSRDLAWGILIGSLLTVLLWSRLVGLDLAFWHDEVYTVIHYAGVGPKQIFFGSYVPNNHVLFSLLAWGTTRVLGESEVTYRLWALVPALIASIWITWWTLRRFSRVAGVALLLFLTVSPLLLQLSREARGYGLLMLAMVGLITQADAALRQPEQAAIWRVSAFGSLGVLTIPVFTLPYIFVAAPLLLEPRLRKRMLIGLSVSGLVAFAWFYPMLDEIAASTGQQFGRPIPWHGMFTASLEQLVFPVYRLLLPGNPDIMLTHTDDPLLAIVVWHAVTWLLLIAAGLHLWRTRSRRLLLTLALPLLGTYGVLASMGAWAADRHVSYLSIPIFVLAAIGVHALAKRFTGLESSVTLALAGILTVALTVSLFPVADYVSRVPHEATKEAAELVNESGIETILTNSVRPQGLSFYLNGRLQQLSADELERIFCDGNPDSDYVFIDHPFNTESVDTDCLTTQGADFTRFNQRGRGRRIDVWTVRIQET
jgi:hypothetical protein